LRPGLNRIGPDRPTYMRLHCIPPGMFRSQSQSSNRASPDIRATAIPRWHLSASIGKLETSRRLLRLPSNWLWLCLKTRMWLD
jgi:hypothetical protein